MSHLDQLKLDLAAKSPSSNQNQLQLDNAYVTSEHGILFGDDCLHTLRNMRAEVIDCVFADPPFNIGKNYKNGYLDRLDE
jgi:16S rRNA G966 N2-methylase RsmD